MSSNMIFVDNSASTYKMLKVRPRKVPGNLTVTSQHYTSTHTHSLTPFLLSYGAVVKPPSDLPSTADDLYEYNDRMKWLDVLKLLFGKEH
ncbi:MAG: hypothetical protein ACI88A_003831 [Paraglaciecola sp.]|jgi:hypothetical protein